MITRFVLPCLLLSATINTSFAYSNWCEGKKWWLMNMSLEERTEKAINHLQETANTLKKEAFRLEANAKEHSADFRQRLFTQQKKLVTQTTILCQQAKSSGFPLRYQNFELRSKADYRLQLRLNLNLIVAQQQMIGALEQEETRFSTHIKQLKTKQNEMRLLSQQVTVQDSPVSATQFINQACSTMQDSKTALEATKKIVLSDVLEKRLAALKKESIETEWLDEFSQHCEMKPLQKKVMQTSDWWQHLLVKDAAE